jgi:hypothetical protein
MLYGDTLGPILAALEDRQNAFLLPRLGEPTERYVEFNIAEKLQGSFEEQAAVMSTLVGAPVFTPNEARSRFNLPAVEGGDQLIVPLNVTQGGQASPQDGGTPMPPAGAAADVLRKVLGYRIPELPTPDAKGKGKTHTTRATPAPDWLVSDSTKALADTFARQQRAISSAVAAAAKAGRSLLAKAADDGGYDPDEFDVPRMNNFLQSVASTRAKWINSTTQQQLQASIEELDDPATQAPAAVRSVFDEAITVRAAASAITYANTLSNLTTNEVGHQFADTATITKTWVVTSDKPRPEHEAMDGETVGIDDSFSNGANWPGDPVLGADGVAGCTCVVDITRKD